MVIERIKIVSELTVEVWDTGCGWCWKVKHGKRSLEGTANDECTAEAEALQAAGEYIEDNGFQRED